MWFSRKKPAAKPSNPPKGGMSSAAIGSLIEGEPEGTADLADAMLTDYQTKLGITVLTANSKQAAVTVVADKGDARAELLAEQLTALYSRKLPAMLNCVTHGRVAFEKVWEYVSPVTFVETLNELPHRSTRMRLTHDGKFDGVELDSKTKKNAVVLGPDKSWWLALDATPTEPHGKSRLLGAPQKLWQDKKEISCLLTTFITRFALGAGIIRGPMEYDGPEGPDGPKLDAQAMWEAQWKKLRTGGFILADNKRVVNSDGSPGDYETDLKMLEVAVRDGRPILDVIDHFDACQLLALGIPPKTVMEGDAVGSFALVSQQMLILLSVVEDIVSQIVESFQRYVVNKVVDLNDDSGTWQLTVNFTPLTQRPDDLATELVKSWLTQPQLSPMILSGAVDVGPILESSGVTASPQVIEKLQGWVNAQAAAAPLHTPGPLAMSSPFLSPVWR